MLVIPAVDIKGGRCVRLEQGMAERETVYGDDPIAPALAFAGAGAPRIHVVDLDGAFEGQPANLELIRRLIAEVKVPVEVGGGVRSRKAAKALLEAGAERVILGTRAIEDPAFLEELAGDFPKRINLGLDAREGKVALRGWTETGELTTAEVLQRVADLPLGEIIHTDIARDGMLSGPNFDALESVIQTSRHPVIASGGVSSESDIKRCRELGAFGAIIGKALYDGRLAIGDALTA